MRHTVLAGFLGLAAVVNAAVMVPAESARIAMADEAPPGPSMPAGPQTKIIDYEGVRLTVPVRWPVYRLDLESARCVRYDRHAVYLGRAGADQDCPARMAGRTETLQIEPLDEPPAARPSRERPVRPVERPVEQEVTLVLPAAGVRMTGTYGSGRALLEAVLRSAAVRPGVRRVLPSFGVPGPESGLRIGVPYRSVRRLPETWARRRGWTTGAGFDACTAPSLAAMAAWRRAYRVANVYIGGAARGCAQPNLTRHWVGAARRMGYRLIPTYVGLQAPCSDYHNRFTPKNAYRRGSTSADDAVRRARALGIPQGEPIYFDMEAYASGRARCRRAVLTFMHAWSRRLRHKRYVSGMYGSAGSGVQDLGEASGITKPEAIWFARWDGKARTAGGRYLRRSWWNPHRRIKQYRGGHRERHRGYTLNIDSNIVDGLVY
jgi:Rv2525c-like, glycoside hydrolase-like domain